MFDISWTEFLLIGVVALVVIGPKELPGVMRTLGQYTRKIRSMASDFQGQFQEAMREAEMADFKKSVDDLASDIKNYDPLKDVRADVESISKDLATPAVAEPANELPVAEAAAQLQDQSAAAADAVASQDAPLQLQEQTPAATATGPATPEAATESVASNSASRAE
jgi:sec-independent protein translocase protein TatB